MVKAESIQDMGIGYNVITLVYLQTTRQLHISARLRMAKLPSCSYEATTLRWRVPNASGPLGCLVPSPNVVNPSNRVTYCLQIHTLAPVDYQPGGVVALNRERYSNFRIKVLLWHA